MAGKNIARQEIQGEIRGENKVGSGRYHVAANGDKCWNLTGKPQPCGDAQIKRNGLI